MQPLFTRVPFVERDNFINYLAKTPSYRNKIAFIEGKGDIPAEIWTNGKKYADCVTDNSVTNAVVNLLFSNPYIMINALNQTEYHIYTEDEIKNIAKTCFDTNNNGIPDWEDSITETHNNLWGEY